MITLVNKNNGSKIIVPDVTVGDRYYMIDNKIIDQKYHSGSMYLDKDKWEIENN